jgi:hypothetical protein
LYYIAIGYHLIEKTGRNHGNEKEADDATPPTTTKADATK